LKAKQRLLFLSNISSLKAHGSPSSAATIICIAYVFPIIKKGKVWEIADGALFG